MIVVAARQHNRVSAQSDTPTQLLVNMTKSMRNLTWSGQNMNRAVISQEIRAAFLII